MMKLRRNFSFKAAGKVLSLAPVFAMALVTVPCASAQTVLTVPWDPSNQAAPHTAIANTAIVLGAIFIPASGAAGDTYKYTWSYGDGSPSSGATAVPPKNGVSYDLPGSHTYSGATFGVTNWTATVTVTDVTTGTQAATGNYLVIWEDGTQLQPRVNVAIDWGLWHLHEAMYRNSTTAPGQWTYNCGPGVASSYACANDYPSLTATNVQAFEVSGHLSTGSGAATDPYATDVAQGLDWIAGYITEVANPGTHKYYFDPAQMTFGCSDGSAPTTTLTGPLPTAPNAGDLQGYCHSGAYEIFYNPNAASCVGGTTSTPCSWTFTANPNGYAYHNNTCCGAGYDAGYEQGMFMDAIIASGNPSFPVPQYNSFGQENPTNVWGQSYLDIVKGYVDYISYCQYGYDYDVNTGATRGNGNGNQGGAWLYDCNQGDDNSTSQWESIGLISAERGFGVPIQQIVKDANQTWTTNAEDQVGARPTGPNPWNAGDDYGGFGYRGNLSYDDEWGPFAVTPSGMVQMSLDGVGRTTNTAFGDATTATDQRFNDVETFYADNFCNSSSNAFYAPKIYTYGLFSFTKAMLLHNPGGVLSPIQYLRTLTPNVFGSTPATNVIDWYGAVGPGHPYSGATPAACDGVAETLVDRQYTPSSPVNPYSGSSPGFWTGDNYGGEAAQYETAWSLIMLNKTVFVQCVNNLVGAGTKGNPVAPARIDLTWTGIPNVTGYNILISTTSGGPYTQVTYNGGTTTGTAFSDRSKLTNGGTYYFVLQPINATGAVCTSNQATVTIP